MPNASARLLISACAAFLVAAPAFGEDIPRRKSGLWEIKTQASGARTPAHSIEMCVDQKSDDAVQQATRAAPRNLCTKNDMKREADRLVIDSVCKFGETTATTHAVITGHFDSAYKVETTSTYDPPMAGIKEGSAVVEARWTGPCKADQKPGDVILSNGTKFNINDAKGQLPPMQPPPRRNPDTAPKQ
jgi:hypothetical protein